MNLTFGTTSNNLKKKNKIKKKTERIKKKLFPEITFDISWHLYVCIILYNKKKKVCLGLIKSQRECKMIDALKIYFLNIYIQV